MGENEVKIKITADGTAVAHGVNEANANINNLGASANKASTSAKRLGRELGKIGDPTDFAASAVKRFRNILEGAAFGVVAGVVSAVTAKLVEYAMQVIVTQEQIQKMKDSIFQQANAWKILPEPIQGATQATINLYNAQLKYLQLLERDQGDALKKQLENFKQFRYEAEINLLAQPGRGEYFEREVEKYNTKITEAQVALEKWQAMQKMQPTSMEEVAAALEQQSETFTDRTPLIMEALRQDEEWTAAQQRQNEERKRIGESAKSDHITYMREADFEELERQRLFWEESIALTTEATKTNNEVIFRAEQDSIRIEKQTQQLILNMKLAAAQEGIALMNVLAREYKELAYAALIVQKGVAMAQVFIDTQAAAAAALAPPPLGLGPVAGAALAAQIETWGYIRMGLIAATGIAEAAMMSSGGSAPSLSGGGGGYGGASSSPALMSGGQSSQSSPPPYNITVYIQGNVVGQEAWVNEELIPAIEEAVKNERSNLALQS